MAPKRYKSLAGITLIEVMAAIVIVTVAVLGASAYRYYSALDARKAAAQSTAARIALMLSENWRGRSFDRIPTYDPVAQLGADIKIDSSTAGPEYAAGFNPLGRYQIVMDGANYWAALSYRDDADDLRALNTVVAWGQNRAADAAAADKTFKLTAYVAD